MTYSTILVCSHLRWHSVFQRPHHLMTRFATFHRVLFVEEPVFEDGSPGHWIFESPEPGVTVCTPHTAVPESGFCDAQLRVLRRMMPKLLAELKVDSHIAWFYTPMALPLMQRLDPELVVYDCMDALNMFLNAPSSLVERENELLDRADIVFTGGPSLFRRLQERHRSAHCFPSSVDAAHFAKANSGVVEPANQRDLPHPRIGFFGVIDERIDLAILDTLAASHPEWQIVMVGPVMKISPDSLPRHSNLHYLGQQKYADLPAYIAGWDVCLMPFARNDATRYISPTKVLEYMAAERPIVSTPITDVAAPYGHIVYLADSPAGFVSACEEAITAGDEVREERNALMQRVIGATSWDLTVERMQHLIDECRRAKGHLPPAACMNEANYFSRPSERHRSSAIGAGANRVLQSATTAIIGAGPTGLSAAYHLGSDAVLLEQNRQIGGWCRSITENGFTFDYAGHIMFSNDKYVHQMYERLLGDNVHWQDREAWIYSQKVYTRYPFQGALYGLPPQVIKECILGAIESRYVGEHGAGHCNSSVGVGSNGTAANGSGLGKAASPSPKELNDCCADGILESTAKLVTKSAVHGANGNSGNANGANGQRGENFEQFIYRVWGAGIAKHFAIPYNKKLWAVPLTEMETSWLGGRVPMPDLEEMIEGALQPVPKPMGPNARFGYPLRGGFQALMNGFLPFIEDQLRLNARVQSVSALKHVIELTDGTRIPYRQLISTMPLPVLIRAMGDDAPDSVREAVAKLRYVSVRCVHLGIGRENLTEKHWIYYPEETVFHRIFVQGNASPFCNPPGGFGLTCEITYSAHKPLPCDGDELTARTIADCRKVGFFREDDPIWAATQVDLPYAYVVYDHDRARNVKVIRDWLATQDIILAGRYSEWEYYNSDHAFIAGRRAAEKAKELLAESAAERPAILPQSDINFSETLKMER